MAEAGFEELLARVRAGDPAAAAAIVRTYQPAIMRMIRVRMADRRLRKLHGESDIFQSVMGSFFVRAALGQYELRGPEDLARLLAVMVRNKVADKARRKDVARDGEPVDERAHQLPAADAGPARTIELRELAVAARARLSPELTRVIALRDDGLGWDAIAAELGATSGEAVRKRLARAVDEIAAALGVEPA